MYFSLEKDSSISLARQLYTKMKEYILNGILRPNEKLPSTRKLAKELNISRNVVVEAYDQLIAEGYLYSIEGSGTYVLEGLSYQKVTLPDSASKSQADLLYPSTKDDISFRTGVPDLHLIPIERWGKLYKEVTQTLAPEQLDYQNSFGMYELRLELAKYLQRARGVITTPAHIIITNGAAQAFHLLKSILSNHDYAILENPSSKGLQSTLSAYDISYVPITLDENGLETSKLPRNNPPKLIFTTPSHQFPTGSILPIKRRIDLIRYAIEQDCYIVEDDYDSEFRYEGNPIPSMQSIEPSRVIYIGTFSKTLSPAIRMGYMVIPDLYIPSLTQAKYFADIHSPILEQLTMAAFIREGYYERHIQNMKKVYAKRRTLLLKLLNDSFKNDVIISGANAGLHLVATFKNITFDEATMQRLQKQRISISPLSDYYISNLMPRQSYDYSPCHSLIFGYGNTNEQQIKDGIKLFYLFCQAL